MLIFGKNPVFEYLKNRPRDVKTVFTADDKLFNKLKNEYQNRIQLKLTDRKNFDRMFNNAGLLHQNIAAEINISNLTGVDELLDGISKKEELKSRPLLILDHLNDPQNFGAIIRSAAFFNVSGIIFAKDRQTPLNATVIKASSGMSSLMNFGLAANINTTLTKLKKSGYWIYSAVATDGEPLDSVMINKPVALVVGSEGSGVSKNIIDNSDFKITISGNPSVESLNVSVTTAILLHHFSK